MDALMHIRRRYEGRQYECLDVIIRIEQVWRANKHVRVVDYYFIVNILSGIQESQIMGNPGYSGRVVSLMRKIETELMNYYNVKISTVFENCRLYITNE
jgi:hypothetical protein